MVSLTVAIVTFLFCAFIFFGVFAYLCLLWTNRRKDKLGTIMTGVMVSLIYTFKIVLVGTVFFVILDLALLLSQKSV